MDTINESIARDLAKAAQLERLRRQEIYAEEKRQKKRDDALTFRIGRLFRDNWPWLARFQIQKSKKENDIEFAPLVERIRQIAADTKYSTNPPVSTGNLSTPSSTTDDQPEHQERKKRCATIRRTMKRMKKGDGFIFEEKGASIKLMLTEGATKDDPIRKWVMTVDHDLQDSPSSPKSGSDTNPRDECKSSPNNNAGWTEN